MATPTTPADTTAADSLLVTLDEVEQLLRISRSRLYELLGSRQIASVKLGRRRYVRRDELERFVADLEDAA